MNKDLDGFKKVCRIDELQEKIGKRFYINDVDVAVFKVNEEVYAVSNICPHQQATIIFDGFVEDGCVICPAHGWEFNLQTGKMHTGGNGLDTFEVKIIDNEIFVKAEDKELNWEY